MVQVSWSLKITWFQLFTGWIGHCKEIRKLTFRALAPRLCTSVHYKPTDSHRYLLYSSSHPSHMSRIPFLIPSFLDFGRLCSEDSDFSLKLEEMFDFLDKRGYLASAVRATKLIVSQHHKRLRGRIMIECHSPRLTFHPHNHAVKSIILKNFKLLQNGSI